MNLPLEVIAVPLRADGHGGYRVGRSHVQLERIIAAHRQGAAPADIVDMYSTLELADVRRKLEAAGMTRPGPGRITSP